jgi:hypothetical protein
MANGPKKKRARNVRDARFPRNAESGELAIMGFGSACAKAASLRRRQASCRVRFSGGCRRRPGIWISGVMACASPTECDGAAAGMLTPSGRDETRDKADIVRRRWIAR